MRLFLYANGISSSCWNTNPCCSSSISCCPVHLLITHSGSLSLHLNFKICIFEWSHLDLNRGNSMSSKQSMIFSSKGMAQLHSKPNPRFFRWIRLFAIPSLFFAMIVSLSLQAAESVAPISKIRQSPFEYQVKDYSYLFGMQGFSDALLKMHFQLYQGYVKNLNLLMNRMREMEQQDKDMTYDYGALKRRFAWEFDGMRLHELYFENLGGEDLLDKSTDLYQKISKDFGSFDAWKKNFSAVGMIRGIGWVILYRDPQTGRLFNTWINEHDVGHLAGGDPLLVMDVFEHAYITQYGLDRGKYISAFFDNVEWQKVDQRYIDAKAKGAQQP